MGQFKLNLNPKPQGPPAPNAPPKKRRYAGVPLRPAGVRFVSPVTDTAKASAVQTGRKR